MDCGETNMDCDFEVILTHFELNLPIASKKINSKFGGLIAPPIASLFGSGGYSPPGGAIAPPAGITE